MRANRLRGAALVLGFAVLLAGVVFVSVALSVVAGNAPEVRSLPKTYRWIIGGFAATWLLGVVAAAIALRRGGRLEWLARAAVVLGANVLVWDMFRGLWLAQAWQVAAAGIVEATVLVGSIALVRRVPLATLLAYAAVFGVAQTALGVANHVRALGTHTVANALREAWSGAGDAPAPHPNPWLDEAVAGPEIPGALDLAALEVLDPGLSVQRDGALRLEGAVAPGAELLSLPVAPAEPLAGPAVAELRLRVVHGSIAVGIRAPVSRQWFYREELSTGGGVWRTVRVPIYPRLRGEPLIVASGHIGTERTEFELEGARLVRAAAGPATASDGPPNVYQILLDEAERASYDELLPEYPRFRYPGFTHFERFHTSSDRTRWSLPQIVTGRLYDPATGESAEEWADRGGEEGIFHELEQHGVSVWQYATYRFQCYSRAHYCLSAQDFRNEFLARVADTFVVDLTFLRLLPNSLRALLVGSIGQAPPSGRDWDYGFSLMNTLMGPPKVSSEDAMLREYYHGVNLFTVNFTQRMLADEANRPARGQYVFIHVLVPHAPHARDAECRFIPAEQRTEANAAERYRGQSVCALELVGWIQEQLELLGRYDDSLVIVHSDHGAPRPPPSERDYQRNVRDSSEWPSWLVESLSAGLLLVKWPGASGFSSSSLPVQTIDLAPTVLEHFGIRPPDAFAGTAIQRMGPDFARVLVFHASNPPRFGARLPYFSRYTKVDGDWRFDGNVPAQP
jgi:hypothetical protein